MISCLNPYVIIRIITFNNSSWEITYTKISKSVLYCFVDSYIFYNQNNPNVFKTLEIMLIALFIISVTFDLESVDDLLTFF